MPKYYICEVNKISKTTLTKIVERVIQNNYTKGNAKEAAQKIVNFFVTKVNLLQAPKF